MMSIAALLFYDLTVESDATRLIFRFGIGLIRQRIPLAAIREAQRPPVATLHWRIRNGQGSSA